VHFTIDIVATSP